MITLHRLNGTEFVLNAEQIKFVEATPDTVITMSTDEKLMVKEAVPEVVKRVIEYKRQWLIGPPETRKS
jgi:flagellar protein FlbD